MWALNRPGVTGRFIHKLRGFFVPINKHPRGAGIASGIIALTLALTFFIAADTMAASDRINPLAVEGPVAPEFSVQPLQTVGRVTTAAIDAVTLRAEDQDRDGTDLPPRFAVAENVNISPYTDGSWEVLDSQFDLWRLRISSPGALSLNLGFSGFRLPKGARLTLYPADAQGADDPRGVRTFTERDNNDNLELWTPVVLGDDLVLELVMPRQSRNDYDLRLTSVNRGYRFFGEDLQASADKSGSCNIDVNCPEGDDWRNEIASVGVFTIGGVWKCTGFMINNTAEDGRALFMTANHCGLSAGNSSSLVVYWNFESPTCGQQGGGSLAQSMTGATFLAASSTSDFALVEMDDPIDPAFEISFSGWNRADGDFAGVVCVHHPSTDEKSISFENDGTTTTSYLGNDAPGDGTHIRVIDWDLGTTEGGSSGSPLYDLNHRFVGQLHGGYAACGNNDSDWYGRLSVTWPQVSTYLDPVATGAMTLDTYNPFALTMSVTPSATAEFAGDNGGPFAPTSVDYVISNNSDVPLTYNASVDVPWADVSPGTGLVPEGGTFTVSVSVNASAAGLGQGQYTGTLDILNLTDNQGDTSRNIMLTVGVPSMVYSFDMDTDPDWATEGLWAWGQPQGGGGDHGNIDPVSGNTGTYVYGYNLAGDYENDLTPQGLRSEAIDCSAFQGVSLKFHRWLNVEQPSYDHASIEVSNDGSNFVTIWENTEEINDSSWTQFEYDISQYADGQETVYLRWVMGTTDPSWQYSGWNIDDVEIWGLANATSDVDVPAGFRLSVGNHPNPFNPMTTVNFVLEKPGRAKVNVYDLQGRLVRSLVDESLSAGPHSVPWDGFDKTGGRVGSGVYLVRVLAGGQTAEHKMVLLK